MSRTGELVSTRAIFTLTAMCSSSDVSENMLVEATGSIDITGGGYECALVSKQHVQVGRSLVGSHVVAGGAGASLGMMRYELSNMVSQLESIVDSVRYLDEPARGDSSRKEAVMRELLETNYRTF